MRGRTQRQARQGLKSPPHFNPQTPPEMSVNLNSLGSASSPCPESESWVHISSDGWPSTGTQAHLDSFNQAFQKVFRDQNKYPYPVSSNFSSGKLLLLRNEVVGMFVEVEASLRALRTVTRMRYEAKKAPFTGTPAVSWKIGLPMTAGQEERHTRDHAKIDIDLIISAFLPIPFLEKLVKTELRPESYAFELHGDWVECRLTQVWAGDVARWVGNGLTYLGILWRVDAQYYGPAVLEPRFMRPCGSRETQTDETMAVAAAAGPKQVAQVAAPAKQANATEGSPPLHRSKKRKRMDCTSPPLERPRKDQGAMPAARLPSAEQSHAADPPSRKPRQCWKCQRWGHSALEGCSAGDVCRTCGGTHRSAACTNKETKFCANCRGPHAASSAKCPMRPKARDKAKDPPAEPAKRKRRSSARQPVGQNSRNSTRQTARPKGPPDLKALLKSLLLALFGE